jgi:hypothetical protein
MQRITSKIVISYLNSESDFIVEASEVSAESLREIPFFLPIATDTLLQNNFVFVTGGYIISSHFWVLGQEFERLTTSPTVK